MLKLLADECLHNDIVRGLLRRVPDADIARVQDVGLAGMDDRTILEWAARAGRILITHDAAALTSYAYERVKAGQTMPGIFEIAPDMPVGLAIEELLILMECSIEGEWEGQVRYLPIR
jgi:hypothetical protein